MLTFFLLGSILTSALGCDWLTEYRDLRNTSMVLIEIMGGAFTDQECSVPFPDRLYEQAENKKVESQLVFIRDNMKQIYDLYRHGNHSSTTWDPVKTTEFLESVSRQIEELNRCVPKHKHRTDSRLRRYYRKLKNCTLGLSGGSAASWELLRKETRDHLNMLDLLGNALRDSPSSSVL